MSGKRIDNPQKVLLRARAVNGVAGMRVNTSEKVQKVEVMLRSDIYDLEDAQAAEAALKGELLELHSHRQRYVEVLDNIYRLAIERKEQNPVFWENVLAILTEGSDEFVCNIVAKA
jgi:uncharacterized protein with von Willebrand factor type A (vWA) domain